MSKRFSISEKYAPRSSFVSPNYSNMMKNSSKESKAADHGFVIPIELPSAIISTMQIPTPLLKYGKSGSPHFRNFYLSGDRTKLIWYSEKKAKNDLSTQGSYIFMFM